MTSKPICGAPVRLAATLALAIAGGAAGALPANAVTTDSFQLRSTQDLADLCSAPRGDAQWAAAIHLCQGFIIGAYQYHQAISAGTAGRPVFCVPAQGGPSRDDATQMFITWARAHPEHMGEKPIDGLTRWAVETWPCARRPAARRATR